MLNLFGAATQTGAVTIGDATTAKASVSISKGATWTIEGAVGIGRGTSVLSNLSVGGTLVRSGATGTSKINVSTGDTGLIEVAAGTLDFVSKTTGNGALKIDAGATLEAETTVASTLTAIFNGASATLALMAPSKFDATIAGFAVSDTIDLLNIAATGAAINAGDQLVIVNGTTMVASLQLTGTYSGATFTIGSDGHGGTDVTLLTASGVTPPIAATTPSPHAFVAALAEMGASSASASIASGHGDSVRPVLLGARGA